MTDIFVENILKNCLEKTGEAAETAELAYVIYRLMEGDDPEDVGQLLQEYGYTYENGEWKNTYENGEWKNTYENGEWKSEE